MLLLWRCCEQSALPEGHGQPAVEEGLPSYALRLQQAADDLGLKDCQLSTRATPPWSTALLETSLLGYRCPAPTTGMLAATKVYTAVQSCLRSRSGTGMKVPWYVNMDTSTCLATWALPRRLSLKPDQRAMRACSLEGESGAQGCGVRVRQDRAHDSRQLDQASAQGQAHLLLQGHGSHVNTPAGTRALSQPA